MTITFNKEGAYILKPDGLSVHVKSMASGLKQVTLIATTHSVVQKVALRLAMCYTVAKFIDPVQAADGVWCSIGRVGGVNIEG